MKRKKTWSEERLDIVTQKGATSFLNNTKWKKLCELLDGKGLTFGAKVLDGSAYSGQFTFMLPWPQHNSIEFGFTGPVPFSAIEWMDVHFAGRDDADEIEAELRDRLKELNVVYSEIDGFFRIYGYYVPSSHSQADAP